MAGEDAMRRIEVKRVGYESCSCNICYARNYEPMSNHGIVGKYEPDIFDVNIGAITGHLCRGCLESLGLAALNVAVGGADHAEGPEH